jgi:uncharacterized tellurite resistance protein B-like protein
MKKYNLNKNIIVGLLTFGITVFCSIDAFARFGGGGGYSGGGGGGFSGGGGGGFSGGGSYGGSGLTISGGGGWVNLLFILAVIVVKILYDMYLKPESKIKRGSATINKNSIKNGLSDIKLRDPDFDEQAFFTRCKNIMPVFQYSWSEQDISGIQHFMSDGMHEAISLQLEMQKSKGIFNRVTDVKVLNAHLVEVSSDDFFDTLDIAITAQAADVTINKSNNKVVQGSKSAEEFQEIWSFVRRPGAKTLKKDGLMEGYCPNCGTALKISTSITCSACKALINSGQYDWVLNEITQVDAWTGRTTEQIAGLADFLEKDPGFNRQGIEDRMMTIFWHHRASEFFAKKDLLSAVALPDFVDKEKNKWQGNEQGKHNFYADPAVGGIDVSEIIPAQSPDDFDRINVRISWSGHMELEKVPSFMVPNYYKSRMRKQTYVLVRKSNVKSSTDTALRSLHCPGCGAANVQNSTGACRYCGLQQNDGSASWVLESIESFAGFKKMPLPNVKLSKLEEEHAMQCMIAIMFADGHVDEKETKYLKKMAKQKGISVERLQQLIDQVNSDQEIEMFNSTDRAEQINFIRMIIRMCLADGVINGAERKLLKTLAARFGYLDADINVYIRKERTAMLQATKAAVKMSKQYTR